MSLGGHWVQVYDERFILLVGNKVSFGAKELSDQSEGLEPAAWLIDAARRLCDPSRGVRQYAVANQLMSAAEPQAPLY